MKRNHFIQLFLVLVTMLSSIQSIGQCPIDEADLADGGTFSGTCTIDVGGGASSALEITGDVVWQSGTLNIESATSNGSTYIKSTGSLTIQSGTVNINDNATGIIEVEDGGSLTIEDGGTLDVAKLANIYGTAVINGTFDIGSTFKVYSTGNLTVNSTGIINNYGSGNNLVQGGTLTSYGLLDLSGNLDVDGGTVSLENGSTTKVGYLDGDLTDNDDLTVFNSGTLTVKNGAIVDVQDDMEVYDDGILTIETGGTMNVDDDVFAGDGTTSGSIIVNGTLNNDGDFTISMGSVTVNNGGDLNIGNGGSGDDLIIDQDGSLTVNSGGDAYVTGNVTVGDGANGAGSITLDGTLTVDETITVTDTSTPNSSLTGTGTITSGGTFTDAECDNNGYTMGTDVFCSCQGGPTTDCGSTPLPVELAYFNLISNMGKVLISWATFTETNNHYFVLYRSFDMINYHPIGHYFRSREF